MPEFPVTDTGSRDTFRKQVSRRTLGRREVESASRPVSTRFISSGKGCRDRRAQPGFHVCDRYVSVKRRQGSRHRGGGIALHHHHVECFDGKNRV